MKWVNTVEGGLPKDKKKYNKSSKGNEVLQPKPSPNTKSSIRRLPKEVAKEKGPVKPKAAHVESKVGKTKRLVQDKEVEDERDSDVEGSDGESDSDKEHKVSEEADVSNESGEEGKGVKIKVFKGKEKVFQSLRNEMKRVKDVKMKGVKGNKTVVVLKAKKRMDVSSSSEEEEDKHVSDSSSYDDSSSSEEEKVLKPKKVSKKKRQVKDESSSSEDEDEKPLKNKKHSKHVKNVKKKKKKLLTAEQIKKIKYLDDLPSLRSRTVPSLLFAAIHDSQVDMESFLSDIGASSYEFKLENGIIRVTLEKVHEILGVPLGGTSIFDLPEIPLDDPFVKEWFKQFDPKPLKEIRACDIAQKLVLTKTVDFMFKVNFLMLFANVMGTVDTVKAIVNLTVLRRIREDTNIAGIDWCGFIHKCLQGSLEPKTLNGFYVGLLSFLILLYLDSTKFDKFPVIRQLPAIRNWTTTAMNRRQELEIEEQVIGKLDLHGEWTESELDQTEGFYDVGENVSRTRTSSVPHTDKKSFCIMIEEKISMISAEKIALEDLLKRAKAEFPNDEKVIELCEKYRRLFKEFVFVEDFQAHIDDFDNNDNDGGGKNDVHGSDNVGKKKESVAKDVLNAEKDGVNAEKDGVNAEKDGVNVVQEDEADVNEEPEDMLEEETFTQWIEKNIDWVGEVIDCLYDAYYEEDLFVWPRAVQHISVVCPQTPQRVVTRSSPNKRIVKPPTFLTSPYMNKRTKVTSLIKRLEFVLGNSLFAMQGDKYETVFQTRSGHDLSSVPLNMETLAPRLWIDANTKAIIEGTFYEEQQWKVFSDEISAQFEHDVSSISLFKVDLAFFPICASGHFYVVVFHLKSPSAMFILDNSNCGETYKSKYKAVCEPLLKWSTTKNHSDCEVFTMMHLEHYFGKPVGQWDFGLCVESDEQVSMLRRMRFKIAGKLLLNEFNIHAEKMFDLAFKFENENDEQKRISIIVNAIKNRNERDPAKTE
ncbi:ulp1 protease family, C-terminal catalytic domain-containing protein [Tanacetum coccineum]|uniref:Ulp1 protease family, C-terminal catalytic domain-containing protein n=1 Tax=Tanacetum coccineum TaxID=301880 RepID=A0ABQ5F8Q7_9ASTR